MSLEFCDKGVATKEKRRVHKREVRPAMYFGVKDVWDSVWECQGWTG